MGSSTVQFVAFEGWKQGSFKYKILKGGFRLPQENANDIWNKIAQEIRKVDQEKLEESRGYGPIDKESWWWNENFQSKVIVKK